MFEIFFVFALANMKKNITLNINTLNRLIYISRLISISRLYFRLTPDKFVHPREVYRLQRYERPRSKQELLIPGNHQSFLHRDLPVKKENLTDFY